MELTYTELIEKRSQLEEDINSFIQIVETEKRFLSEDENNSLESRKNELSEVVDKLIEIEKAKKESEKEIRSVNIKNNNKNMSKFSIISLINECVNNNYSTESRGIIDAGLVKTGKNGEFYLPVDIQSRAIDTTNQGVIAKSVMDLDVAMRAKLIAGELGCEIVTGLEDNVSYPLYTGASYTWAGENELVAAANGTLSNIDLMPMRLSGTVEISNSLLAQAGKTGIEAKIMNDLYNGIICEVEKRMWSATAGVAGKSPAGLANGKTYLDASNYAGIVSMEAVIESDNMLQGNLAYITNSQGKSYLKTTLKAANVAGYLMDVDGTVNGYKTLSTSNVGKFGGTPKNGIIFGDFSKVVICQWGDLQVIVDPYTRKKENITEVTVNALFNFGVKNPKALSFGVLNA